MKQLLASIFSNTEERIKNPFIGAFMTSWIIFNWKPILFLILSSKTIENKILYIELTFSNIWFIFIYPLITALFYVLILPYVNLIFDEVLKYSIIKRNNTIINKQKQLIENQKELAIEEIKLEEAKTEYRERNTHNKLVEELQDQIENLQSQYINEKEKNNQRITEFQKELTKRENMNTVEFRDLQVMYNDMRSEVNELNKTIHNKNKEIQTLQSLVNNGNDENNPRPRSVIKFENGLEVEQRIINNEIIYYDRNNKKFYSTVEINGLMANNSYRSSFK